jgi:hypothetical protein
MHTDQYLSEIALVDPTTVPVIRRLAPIIKNDALEKKLGDAPGSGCFGMKRVQVADEADGVILMCCVS